MVNVASDGWECWRQDDIISFVCTCWKWFREKKAFRISCTSTTISEVLISCLMLWKSQIKGGHCPEVFIIMTTKPTVVLCEYPAQNMLQAALYCWRTWGSGITCLEIKVEA